MTTRIDAGGPAPLVSSSPTAQRSTAVPTRPFQAVMSAGAGAVMNGAEAAVLRLPGGPILAAAFRPGGAPSTTMSGTVQATPEGYPTQTTNPNGTGGTTGTSDAGLEGMLDQNSDKNLYYIALQEKISAENRLYSAYSNVLRVRHETMKNAIGNFR